MTWRYIPPYADLLAYGSRIRDCYPEELYKLFRNSLWMNTRMKYRCPCDLIKKGERIVLYGAGNVGQEYCRWINETHYVELAAWVDMNHEELGKTVSIGTEQIQSPEIISSLEFDHILISVLDGRTSVIISDYLISSGVNVEKIIWTGKEVYEF